MLNRSLARAPKEKGGEPERRDFLTLIILLHIIRAHRVGHEPKWR
jgi:hypothetical protein